MSKKDAELRQAAFSDWCDVDTPQARAAFGAGWDQARRDGGRHWEAIWEDYHENGGDWAGGYLAYCEEV
jgi:hypothetical protein